MNYKKKAEEAGMALLKLLKDKAGDNCSRETTNLIDTVCFHLLPGSNTDTRVSKRVEANYFYLSKVTDYVKESEISDLDKFLRELVKQSEIISQEVLNMSTSDKNDYIKKQFTEKIKTQIEDTVKTLREKGYTREELIELEQEKVRLSCSYFEEYESQSSKARGEIMGSLNNGFYGKSLIKLKEDINAEVGEVSSSGRYTEYMDEDLLIYRIALLEVAESFDKDRDKHSRLNYVKRDIRVAGLIAREIYEEDTSNSPEVCLKSLIGKILDQEVPKPEITGIGVARKRRKNRQLDGQLEFKF